MSYKPVRTSNVVRGITLETGFDAATLFRDPATGLLDVKIIEAKCWSKSNNLCEWKNLTALGANVPDILRQNKEALIKHMTEGGKPTSVSAKEWEDLITRVRAKNDFTFVLYGLPETNFASAEIDAAIRALGFKNVEFKNVPLQPL